MIWTQVGMVESIRNGHVMIYFEGQVDEFAPSLGVGYERR